MSQPEKLPRHYCVKLKFCLFALATLAAAESSPAEMLEAAGITEPICDVVLSASVPGIVSAWRFKEGDFVKEGDAIIDLDKRLEELEVERRKLAMDNRRTDYQAMRTLLEKNSISVKKEEMEKAETDYKIAVAEHEMAAEQLRRRSVIAPCSGNIVEIVRDVGEAIQAYQPIIRVVDTRQCYFISNIEAKAAGRLKLDQMVKLEVETPSAPAAVEGKVVYLSPVVDPASGLQRVKVLFDNNTAKIRPGVAGKMFFE